ncbi:hypothetical protein PM082_008673 [Marasmius tenuissimus]|nr:hypothetical protein PM082_008673 [Marasmius tenuissimus]
MPRDKSSKATTKDPIGIQATSQQTRFDLNEHTASKDSDLHTVNVSIGKHDVLTDSHLKLSPGVHYVLVGRNGVGKSTLLRAIGEEIIPGVPKSMRILLLLQSYDVTQDKPHVLSPFPPQMSASTAELRAKDLLLGLGFTTTTISQPLKSLSGGWHMRTVLASLLFQPCDILLLDEPTNFLDMPSLLWLKSHLQERTDTTLLLVSHDRTFADSIAEEIIVMRDCKLERYPGNLTAYEKTRSEQKKRLTRMKEAQDWQKAYMQDTTAGNVRAALVSGDDKKLKQATSRQKKLDERMGTEVGLKGVSLKLNRDLPGYHTNMRAGIEIPQDENAAKVTIPSEPSELRYPGALVSVENLSFKYERVTMPTVDSVSLLVRKT